MVSREKHPCVEDSGTLPSSAQLNTQVMKAPKNPKQIGRHLLQGPGDSLLHQGDHDKNVPVDRANSLVTRADGNEHATGKHFISAKGETRLGYWNVRTLSESSRVAQLVEVFNEKRLDLPGVTETHLPNSSKTHVSEKKNSSIWQKG